MKKPKLNTKKIKVELNRLGKTQSWLAEQMGVSKQRVSAILKDKPITKAWHISKVLGYEAKDLIK